MQVIYWEPQTHAEKTGRNDKTKIMVCSNKGLALLGVHPPLSAVKKI